VLEDLLTSDPMQLPRRQLGDFCASWRPDVSLGDPTMTFEPITASHAAGESIASVLNRLGIRSAKGRTWTPAVRAKLLPRALDCDLFLTR
jgi:hypothetical protein